MRPIALFALVAPLTLAACNDPTLVGVPEVRIASAYEVAACTPISRFTTTPGISGPIQGKALEIARNRTLINARDAGANTMVWDPDSAGDQVYIVQGTGYRC